MILETDRLTLRPLQSTDVEAVASYSTKPEFIRFLLLPPQTMESAAQFVGQAVANGQPDAKGDWLFAIQVREEPRLIGIIRIGVRSTEHRQGDVGYAVHPTTGGRDTPPRPLGAFLSSGSRICHLSEFGQQQTSEMSLPGGLWIRLEWSGKDSCVTTCLSVVRGVIPSSMLVSILHRSRLRLLSRLPRYTSYRGRDNNERRQCFHRQADEQPGTVAAFCVL
jgi:hypothetical protein